MNSKYYEASGYGGRFGFALQLVLIASFISYEKWVHKENNPFKGQLTWRPMSQSPTSSIVPTFEHQQTIKEWFVFIKDID